MDPVLSLAIWDMAFVLLCGLAALVTRGRTSWSWALAALILFNLNVALVLDLFRLNARLEALIGSPELAFNWSGKAVALAASAAVLLTGIIKRQSIGLTLRQAKGAVIGWVVVGALCALGIVLAIFLPDEPQTAETIAYQLTMPSLEEEIFYRGILLYCLTRAFGEGPRIAASNFGSAALISTAMFTMIHGVMWTDDGVFWSAEVLAFAGVFGLLLCWLRLNTGSLLAPMVMHSAINTIWRLL